MSAVQWSPLFETGVREIDDQHRRLVALINQLSDMPPEAQEGLNHALETAIDYTLYHFAFEEAHMEAAGYHMLGAHKHIHDQFAEELHGIRQRFIERSLTAENLKELLVKWLFDHIRSADTAAMRIPPSR